MKVHENVLVFYDKQPTYNPQKTGIDKPPRRDLPRTLCRKVPHLVEKSSCSQFHQGGTYVGKFPVSVQVIARDKQVHNTQKPVALFEYLIKTYTNPGDTVLDNCMGSATTAVACIQSGRQFIGIEKDDDYFRICQERVRDTQRNLFFQAAPEATI